jgi:hypothetical protein
LPAAPALEPFSKDRTHRHPVGEMPKFEGYEK